MKFPEFALMLFIAVGSTNVANAVGARGGSEGGGGGKGVYCKADPARGFANDGLYALDYALAPGPQWQDVGHDPILELKAVSYLFSHQLRQEYPSAGRAMNQFIAAVSNQPSLLSWRYLNFELGDTQDAAQGTLPRNCRQSLQQLTTKNDEVYFTNPQLYQQMQQTGSMQVSAHLLHEMLRTSVTDDSDQLAQWNQFLHDPANLNLSREITIRKLVKARIFGAGYIELFESPYVSQYRTGADRIKSLDLKIKYFRSLMKSFVSDAQPIVSQMDLELNEISAVAYPSQCAFARQQSREYSKLDGPRDDLNRKVWALAQVSHETYLKNYGPFLTFDEAFPAWEPMGDYFGYIPYFDTNWVLIPSDHAHDMEKKFCSSHR